MTAVYWILALVAAQRLAELALAARNTRALLARGGVEHGAGHYPLIVALHVAWLATIAAAVPADARIEWPALAGYLALQPIRYWAIATLGERWTTRVITVPGEPPIRRGPYRLVHHPNYLVVAGEIALVPLIFGAWHVAAVFSALNAVLLTVRIRTEDAVLASEASALPSGADIAISASGAGHANVIGAGGPAALRTGEGDGSGKPAGRFPKEA